MHSEDHRIQREKYQKEFYSELRVLPTTEILKEMKDVMTEVTTPPSTPTRIVADIISKYQSHGRVSLGQIDTLAKHTAYLMAIRKMNEIGNPVAGESTTKKE